jgi:hypothetical protein
MKRLALAVVAAALLSPAAVLAQEEPQPEPEAAADATEDESAQKKQEEDDKSDFDKLIEEATLREGFFDTFEKDGKLYLLVPEDRLGEEFLMTFEASQGPGTRGIYGGSMLDREARIVALEKHQGQVYLVQRPHIYVAPDGSPVEQSIDLTFGKSVLAAGKIAATRDETDHLVDVYDWFVSDLSGVGERLRFTVATTPGQQRGSASFDKSRSFLDSVKSFPRNLTINAKLTFKPGQNPRLRSVPDNRYIPVTVHARIAALPEVPMESRMADDRVGYFMTVHKDFSRDDGQDFFVRYARKWRLECDGPADGDGLCAPRQPITYYIDRTVPEQYRPAIMEGVEAFNEAFEEAGFRSAIRAELLPEDADAEDLRYATIRWNVSDPVGYGAIGPSVVDPRTGEILDADILVEGNIILRYRNTWRFQVSPVAALTEMFEATPEELDALANGAEMASFGEEMASQGMLIRSLLVARGELGPSQPVPMEYVNQALKWVTMHEVGHTLGLRHNFRSSYDTPNDKLYDVDWTGANGVFSSVMEYPTPNIAPLGEKNGDFYNRGMGTYDKWAIAFGYTPDPERAKELARLAAKPGHAYGTDEDARGPGALDPTVNVYDLGQDPLEWGRERAATIRGTWASVPAFSLEDDAAYANATQVFNSLLFQYARALATGVKYIGGQYQYRDHVGDPDARGPWRNVDRGRQVEALDFLVEYAFSESAFDLPEDVLQQLGADRWSHWGNTNTFNGRIDYPYHETVLGLQSTLMRRVLHPWVFSRIRDAEMKYGADQVLTIPELMDALTGAVWNEVTDNENVPAMRRDLQRAHLDGMVELVTDAPGRTPADARSVARLTLDELHGKIAASLESGGMDAYTRAHLNESKVRIERALKAGLELSN